MQELLKLIKTLIESVDLTIYSYVKPAAPHRYSTRYKDLHSYVRIITSALDTYSRAADIGEDIAKGRMGFIDSQLGSLIRKAMQESTHALEETLLPEYHIVMIPAIISASYSIKLKGYLSIDHYRKSVRSLLMYNNIDDTLNLYDVLRTSVGEVKRGLSLAAITPGKVRTERMTILDLLSEIGKYHKSIEFYVRRHNAITELGLKFVRLYLDSGNYNLAATSVYSELLEYIEGIKVNTEIKDKNDFMRLLKTDAELHSKGIHLTHAVPLLNEAILIGLLSIEYPKQ